MFIVVVAHPRQPLLCRCVWRRFCALLMRLLRAHSRKPASDIYLRDYLIGGVVWIKR